MSYELRLSPRAQNEISRIVLGKRLIVEEKLALLDTIYAELNNLACNPHLGTIPKGPFGRPIHRFRVGPARHNIYLQAAYIYTQDEKSVEILDVGEIDTTAL